MDKSTFLVLRKEHRALAAFSFRLNLRDFYRCVRPSVYWINCCSGIEVLPIIMDDFVLNDDAIQTGP
jgi:hypothetical protein